ncbi:MAG: helix-turn-helix domain-containing protein [Gammaproteobacteria bacterium]|nr:helix-turn-helix domain-containing protein [Gammaproteobacteria bacterium]
MGKAFTEISAGLIDAIAHAKGDESRAVLRHHTPIDVKAIREKTGMSQERFSATFGIPIGTLRHWEQGLRTPRGTARVLLKIVDSNPKAVIKAIQAED